MKPPGDPILEPILDLKTEAKNLRDRGPSGYPRALSRLASAIELAEKALTGTTVPEALRALHKELADCHGMVGGVERRWSRESEGGERLVHAARACAAYDRGYDHEWNAPYPTPATYNLVNRLTGRLLLRPDLLQRDETVEIGDGVAPLNLAAGLNEAIGKVEHELANKGNFWTEADRALLQVLTARMEPSRAYAPFFALSPPGFAFASALDALRPLAAAALATREALQNAVSQLEARRPSA